MLCGIYFQWDLKYVTYDIFYALFLKIIFIRYQRSARVSKKSRSRQLLPSLGKSRSRKTLNCSLGKVSVSRDLKICSLEKSRSRRNRKFESRKSLGLDNFHWIVSEITKFRKTDSKGGLWQLYSSLNLNFVPRNHDTIPYPCNLIHIIPK